MNKPITLAAVALLATMSASAYAAPAAKGSLLAARSLSGSSLANMSSSSKTTRTVTFRTSPLGILPGLTTLLSQDGLLNKNGLVGKLIIGPNSLIPNGIPLLGGELGKPFGGFLAYLGTLPGLGKIVANL